MARQVKEGKGLTRLERARIVREAVLAISATHGHWEDVQLGAAQDGRTTRSWTVGSGQGWQAWVDMRFTRPVSPPSEAQLYASALQGLDLPKDADHCVDVIWEDYGKVVSISQTDGVDSLIGFTAGPWEAAFGCRRRTGRRRSRAGSRSARREMCTACRLGASVDGAQVRPAMTTVPDRPEAGVAFARAIRSR